MKLLSLLTLTALLSVTACSHHRHHGHDCCKKEKQCCSKDGPKDKKSCEDGKCERMPKKSDKKEEKKA